MSAIRRAPRIALTPRTIRYTPPTTLTALNTTDDATITAESPAAAASTWTTDAVWIPSTDTNPAPVPSTPLRATMNNTDGPGTTSNTSAATTNTGRVDNGGMALDGSHPTGRCSAHFLSHALGPAPGEQVVSSRGRRHRQAPLAQERDARAAAGPRAAPDPPHADLGRRPPRRAARHVRRSAARRGSRPLAPKVVETVEGHEVWEFDGQIFFQVGLNAVVGRDRARTGWSSRPASTRCAPVATTSTPASATWTSTASGRR